MKRTSRIIALVACVAVVATSCGSCDSEPNKGGPNNGSADSGTSGDATANNGQTNNGGASNNGIGQGFIDQTREEFCAGDGPPIIVGDTGGGREAVCTGDLAQVTFRYGICACNDLVLGNSLMSDAFDSNGDPTVTNTRGGAVGVNGYFEVGNSANVGGSLWVAGTAGVKAGNGLTVGNRLYSNGPVEASTVIQVEDEATVAGDISVSSLEVGGTLRISETSNVNVNNQMVAQVDRGPVVIDEPCDCDDVIDIAAFTANHREHNHNADIGLDPNALVDADTSLTLDLPCGVFFVEGGEVSNALQINVTGRTVLFVSGNLHAGNSIIANVADGAEFDMFVEGNVTTGNSMSLGQIQRAAAARLYVGGTEVKLGNGGQFAGNLYAPRATVTVGNSVIIYGSMFGKDFVGGNSFIVHYDSAILTAGEGCADTGSGGGGGANNGGGGDDMCSSCEDCGNQACNGGTCGACATDADCCSPLVCYQGECLQYYN